MITAQAKRLMKSFLLLNKFFAGFKMPGEISHAEFMMLQMISSLIQQENQSETISSEKSQGVTISALSKALSISMPAVSQMVNALETKEFVIRTQTKKDRRITYVQITGQGEKIRRELMKIFSDMIEKVVDRLGNEEVDRIAASNECLYQTLKEINDAMDEDQT